MRMEGMQIAAKGDCRWTFPFIFFLKKERPVLKKQLLTR